ncbi:MAG: 16S rRNA (cytosine(1402)-N(4))-methyltransferase RsmH, partial [Phycisphaeraceae bacterium]|nr:16S rRNA (cytosine(1402)-N(4))-methyltransferase RsmH [Phycisphaeraceae bacterium]
ERLAEVPAQVDLVRSNFARADAVLGDLGLSGVDFLLADLGFASNQLDDPERGLSFMTEGPLDMRLDPSLPSTAADLVNATEERALADLLYQLGEERQSRKIARKIVERRAQSPIVNTEELVEAIEAAVGSAGRHGRVHPATRTFMALRIAVNQELQALERLLEMLPTIIKPEGRAAIISFHSLEDRRVKQAFRQFKRDGLGEPVTRKPVTASAAEAHRNPRSRSAKLRTFHFSSSDN